MSKEPVVSLVLGLIAAGVALLVAFGVDITAEQAGAMATFAGAALALGFYVRSKVVPAKKLPLGLLNDITKEKTHIVVPTVEGSLKEKP